MARRGLALPTPARDRYELFSAASARIADLRVLYMEFGVGAGDSFRYWLNLLRSPEAQLHGFDTFEGLPTDWHFGGLLRKGAFSTDGRPPDLDDPRAKFFVGPFAETLPRYEWPAYDQLVVACDADLYSSTVTVLTALRDRLIPGSLLYFDEFFQRTDELRAFDEFLTDTGQQYEVVGATGELKHVMFRRV